ncbi:MAG: glutathione S-transferase [Aliidongia sp.]|nr:glutathione S-transferase [Aliidongia sp.]
MIVYGSSLSPFVRKVLVVIAEKGMKAEHKPTFPHDKSPEFRATSPLGKIPGFADGGFQLCDSSAICHYLERKYPTPALLPTAAEQYGRAICFDEFADTTLMSAVGKIFWNLVVKKLMNAGEPDMAIVETALNDELPPLFAYLESQIDGPYLVGDTLTLADIAIASPFVNLKIAGHPLDTARWPKLSAWLEPILARPSFVNAKD